MLVTVFTDHFLREIRLTNLDILTVARCCHSKNITVALYLEAESAENVKNILCRNSIPRILLMPLNVAVNFLPSLGAPALTSNALAVISPQPSSSIR